MAKQTNSIDENSKSNGVNVPNDKLLHVPTQDQAISNNKKDEEEDETQPTADVVVPTDGGWGWVIVVASFCCTLVVDGIVMNSSNISSEIQKEFGLSVPLVIISNVKFW